MVNKVIIVGRLGSNPELKNTTSGSSVTQFNVATNENWVDKSGQKQERTEWHRIVVWGKLATICSQYLSKGSQVYIEGKLQTRQWQDKDNQTRYTTEIVALSVQFLSSKSASGDQKRYEPSFQASQDFNPGLDTGPALSSSSETTFLEEDMPF